MIMLYGATEKGSKLDLLSTFDSIDRADRYAVEYALSPDHGFLYLTSSTREIWLEWDLGSSSQWPWVLLKAPPAQSQGG